MLGTIFKPLLILLAVLILGFAALICYYAQEVQDYSQLAHYNPPTATRIYTIDGKLMSKYSSEYRIFVPIAAIPSSLINAFIAAEDKNFYVHGGIDLWGAIRALVFNIINIVQNKRLQGASTITQQVVKNFLLSSERSLKRKIKEAILAYQISKVFSKEQILELYLNQIYLGNGAYGVAAAAQTYFNKLIDDLTVPEMAILAALAKSPSGCNPGRYPARAEERRNYVLNRMLEDGYINRSVALRAASEPIILHKRDEKEIIRASYYAEQVRSEAIRMLGKEQFYKGGLTIITCLDSSLQQFAEDSFIGAIKAYDHRYGYRHAIGKIDLEDWQATLSNFLRPPGLLEYQLAVVLRIKGLRAIIGLADGQESYIPASEIKWTNRELKNVLKAGDVIAVAAVKQHYALRQIPAINGGLIAMNYYTGQVLAMVGGYDFAASKFNRATQAMRQPGSTIKPFVYLAALERGIEPNSIYADQAIEISQGRGMPKWCPKNIKGDYLGNMTMRRGLELSRNLVTVRVAQAAGLDHFLNLVKRLGISSNIGRHYATTLGALETTLEKLTNAYAIVARGGRAITPQYIEVIKDREGKILYQRNTQHYAHANQNEGQIAPEVMISQAPRLIDEVASYQLTSMLEGAVVRGTAKSAASLNHILAGKTGTTNNNFDVWFIGYSATPSIVLGVYMGHDNPSSLGSRATGATAALPAFVNFMQQALKGQPNLPFIVPKSVLLKQIDLHSGFNSSGPGSIVEAFRLHNQYLPSVHMGDDQYIPEDIFEHLKTENNLRLIEEGGLY